VKKLCFCILAVAIAPGLCQTQARNQAHPLDEPDAQTNVGPSPSSRYFPLPRAEKDKFHGIYRTDRISIGNYNNPGLLVLGLGDELSGTIATFSACDIWKIDGLAGDINWGDGSQDEPLSFPASTSAATVFTPQKAGIFNATVTIQGYCEDAWLHKNVWNTVAGKATVQVYDSIPIAAFTVTCQGSTPCSTAKSGTTLSGIVTTSQPVNRQSPGNLVLFPSRGRGRPLPT
jgi:hypothetical protein